MILSFHPLIPGEENINCAGRPPGPEEKKAAAEASAVFVPQGVREDLYRLCRAHTDLVWPNQDVRFDYPGKIGQALLFARTRTPSPKTVVFPSVADFNRRKGGGLSVPYVLKTNLGGQGCGVFLVKDADQRREALAAMSEAESVDRGGFLQQEFIDHGGRDLRVVLIGRRAAAYWRIAPDGEECRTNMAVGGSVDYKADPELMGLGVDAARRLAERLNIDLAAFDLAFDQRSPGRGPLLLEINWFFGRSALGGGEAYYRMLAEASREWLNKNGLQRGKIRSRPRYTRRD